MEVLEYFNFGMSIKTWVGLFQKGSETYILQHVFLSEFFNLGQRSRQGDYRGNIYVRQLIKVKKGSRVFYDMFVNVKEFVQQNKWLVEMGNISEKDRTC